MAETSSNMFEHVSVPLCSPDDSEYRDSPAASSQNNFLMITRLKSVNLSDKFRVFSANPVILQNFNYTQTLSTKGRIFTMKLL